jgi:glutathione synthase/RimK-type ligase-like ATP-grasp enzyme
MLLIVTEQFDPHVDFVEPVLEERSIPWRRFHLGDFPARVSAGCEIHNGHVEGLLCLNGDAIPLQDIHAVWYRRTERIRLPADLDEGDKLLAERESRAFIQGLWRVLNKALWVSTPDAIRQASSKAEQLVRAAKCGFHVPTTCISNDVKYIHDFLEGLGDQTEVIYKPHTPIMVDQPDGKKGVVYTMRLGREQRERLEEIRFTPGIFQAYIPKEVELRVTVVHDEVFACAIDSQAVADTRTDWRAHRWGDVNSSPPHATTALPEQLADACRKLVSSYGLMFGAIDLIRDPTGRYHFLELNPNGQWAWIQQRTGLPIREKLCSVFQKKCDG